MDKNNIDNTITTFRDRLESARRGANAGPDTLLAVQELLKEINHLYPQTAFKPDMATDAGSNDKLGKNYFNPEGDLVPQGVKYMLKNMENHFNK